MPNPTPGDVHVNRPLTNMMISWRARSRRYAFNSAFPFVGSESQSNRFYEWDRADVFRDEARERGPRARAPRTGARLTDDAFFCRVFGLEEAIDDQQRANADQPLNLDMAATRRLTDKMMLSAEKRWTSSFFTTGVWTGSTTGTDLVGGGDFTKFASPSTGTPVVTIKEQIKELGKLVDPSQLTLTVGCDVWNVISEHDELIDKYVQVQPGIMNEELFAAALGIKQVVVPQTAENTAAEGAAPVMEYVHSDKMLLSFAPDAPSIEEPSAGYTFAWNGLTGSSDGMRILRYREEPHIDVIEVEGAHDFKATAPELGVFFDDCI